MCGALNVDLFLGNHPNKDRFLSFINSHTIFQPINEPTRITSSISKSLDIFLVSEQDV